MENLLELNLRTDMLGSGVWEGHFGCSEYMGAGKGKKGRELENCWLFPVRCDCGLKQKRGTGMESREQT